MAKAKHKVQEHAKLVDVILEVLDARIPLSSRNPEIGDLLKGKPRVVILNKADLADPRETSAWAAYFTEIGTPAGPVDAVTGDGTRSILTAARSLFAPKIREMGIRRERPFRAMVVGIPNVGKSSLINRLVRMRKAPIGANPGVTRGLQWVRAANDFELLDVPGILLPKFEDPEVGFRLAAVGAVKDEVFDQTAVAGLLLRVLWAMETGGLRERLGLSGLSSVDEENLAAIARHRGLIRSGGRPDIDKVAPLILKEFRAGRLGRFTLEIPPTERPIKVVSLEPEG
jgi:ribosome biogenesis GTPase A